jgi:predicted dehydrogenase
LIRLGIVGCNFGLAVHLPAFRADPRCEVVALAGSDLVRTRSLARAAGIAAAFGNWVEMVDHSEVQAVAIATPPALQSTIALRALALQKPVFGEKPLAADVAQASAMLSLAVASRCPAMIDFEFPEIMAWRRAKELLDAGTIGALRHVVVTWNVENAATRQRLKSWKTSPAAGGGVLGNFVCHCLYYIEWFAGRLQGLSARLFSLPGADSGEESTASLSLVFASGAGGSLTVSCASYAGSGHRLEFYGNDGTLMLINDGSDTARGFRLFHARRPQALAPVAVEDPLDRGFEDGRIAPVAQLAARFLDAVEQGGPAAQPVPGFAEGYRVQELMAAARCSQRTGRWIDLTTETFA